MPKYVRQKSMVMGLMAVASLAWPDRFFPFLSVFICGGATTNKNGKKRSGHARLGGSH